MQGHFPIFLVVIGGVLLGGFAVLMAMGIRRGVQSRQWRRVSGVVRSFSFSYGVPKIAYEYRVDGATYPGEAIAPGVLARASGGYKVPRSLWLREDGQLRFPPGAEVVVWVNPEAPEDAVLCPGTPPGWWKAGLALLGLVLVFALFVTPIGREEFPLLHRALAVFAGCGVILFISGCRAWAHYLRTRHYPTTAGRLLRAEVTLPQSGENASYYPEIEFEYLIDGTPYRSGQWTALPDAVGRNTPQEVERHLDTLRTLPELQVHYNPRLPWDAFLKPGPAWGVYTRFGMALAFWAVAFFLLPPL